MRVGVAGGLGEASGDEMVDDAERDCWALPGGVVWTLEASEKVEEVAKEGDLERERLLSQRAVAEGVLGMGTEGSVFVEFRSLVGLSCWDTPITRWRRAWKYGNWLRVVLL